MGHLQSIKKNIKNNNKSLKNLWKKIFTFYSEVNVELMIFALCFIIIHIVWYLPKSRIKNFINILRVILYFF